MPSWLSVLRGALWIGAVGVLSGSVAFAQSASGVPASPLSFAQAIARALEANRTFAAARARRAVDAGGVAVAGQRPNPEITFEDERETPRVGVGASIPIEVAGKRARRIGVAQAVLAVTDADLARAGVELRASVRRAYFQQVAASRRVAVAQDLELLATRARDAAQERYSTGAAPRLEALQARLAWVQAQNETSSARGELVAARATLNALLAFPIDAPTELSDPLEAGPMPAAESLTALALATNSELQVLSREVDAARARVALAEAQRRPDPSVQGTATFSSPPEFAYGWRFGFTIALPILTTGRPEVAVAQATLAQAITARDAFAAELAGDVASAVARATAARRAVDRYQQEILPASLEVEAMAQESYRSGQTGLAALLQMVQAARTLRLNALQAGLDYQLALADLERAMGSSVK